MIDPSILDSLENNITAQSELYSLFLKITTEPGSLSAEDFEGWSEDDLERLRAEFLKYNEDDQAYANYHATHVSPVAITIPAPTEEDPDAVMTTQAVNGYDGRIHSGQWTQGYSEGRFTNDGITRPAAQYRDLGAYGDEIMRVAQDILNDPDSAPDLKAGLGEFIVQQGEANVMNVNNAIDGLITELHAGLDGPSSDQDTKLAATFDVLPPTIA